jgi:glycosyltransferase involved in cell wall biosynthesis
MVDLSVIVLTCNRTERCVDSVWHNTLCLQGTKSEVIVVNNGGEPLKLLPSAIAGIPCKVLNLPENIGVVAKNRAIDVAAGKYLLILDDDSYISPGLAEKMINSFNAEPFVAAVAFPVCNDSGEEEGCLLPTIFHGCVCGFRKDLLIKAGGYPEDFTYYGEEYDLAFRIYQMGYKIAFCNLRYSVRHARDTQGRDKNRIIKMLVQNNVKVCLSYFPLTYIPSAIFDVLYRYNKVAKKEKAERGFKEGILNLSSITCQTLNAGRKPIEKHIFRKILLMDQVENIAAIIKQMGKPPLVICGIGKFPSIWLKIFKRRGIKPVSFWDFNSCWLGSKIKGIPLITIDPHNPDLPPVPVDAVWLLGLASLPENKMWLQILADKLSKGKGSSPALPHINNAAKDASAGIIDMGETFPLQLISSKNLAIPDDIRYGIHIANGKRH